MGRGSGFARTISLGLGLAPGYRGLGIGSDLYGARSWWAQRMGASQILAEISTHNVPSLSIARPGRDASDRRDLPVPETLIWHSRVPRYVLGAPQFGQRCAVESINAPQNRQFTFTVSRMTICWILG